MCIDYFEQNKSTRATCQKCKEFITDKMRGVEESKNFGHKEYHYFCLKCSGKLIQEAKKTLQDIGMSLKSQLKRLQNEDIETLPEKAERIKRETAYEECNKPQHISS